MNKEILILFTSSYPFGNKAETFLETEIKYLSSHFQKIYILPSGKENNFLRSLPNNVEIVEILTNPDSFNKKVFLIKNILLILKIYIFTICKKGNFKYYFKKYKIYLDILVHEIWKSKEILKFVQEKNLEQELFYDYWFENSALALSILKRKKKINSFFCRIHSFDLYDERWETGRVPFREFKIKFLDAVFSISEYGRKYFLNIINKKYYSKIKLSYIGINKFEKKIIEKADKQQYTIVSCSSIQPFKQVDKIIETLKYISIQIKWIHFGSGPLENELKKQAIMLPSNIEVDFKGHVSNDEIISYYKNNSVDLFITLSRSEGLPVSIMEAISFGIPVLATDVNGIPEIVSQEVGLLVNINETPQIIAQKIQSLLISKPDGEKIVRFFEEHFEAEKNYTSFIHQIKAL